MTVDWSRIPTRLASNVSQTTCQCLSMRRQLIVYSGILLLLAAQCKSRYLQQKQEMEMIGVLGHDSAQEAYTLAGTTSVNSELWINGMVWNMPQVQDESLNLQANVLPLCSGYLHTNDVFTSVHGYTTDGRAIPSWKVTLVSSRSYSLNLFLTCPYQNMLI